MLRLVLKYHSVNPQALLLKAETLQKIYSKQYTEKKPNAPSTYAEMEKTYITLAKLGYREMPEKMYRQWLQSLEAHKEKFTNKRLMRLFRLNNYFGAYLTRQIFFTIPLIWFTSFLLSACNDLYKAGSRPILIDLEIKSNINQDIVLKYLDTIHYKNDSLFRLPTDYNFLKNGGDLEYFPDRNKVAYFSNNPLEVYQLTSNGIFLLAQVYTPSINPNGWITDRARLNKLDYDRIERRIDTLLVEAVMDARLKNIPDSVIFWRKPYDKIICQVTRPSK